MCIRDRYSTDENWHVPHFEKMLYDQAQLCVAFSQAYQATKDDKYRKVINGILKYVTRDLKHDKGISKNIVITNLKCYIWQLNI